MWQRAFALAGAYLLTTGMTAIEPRSTEADARCLVANTVAGQYAVDPAVRRDSTMAMLFFLGRLEARLPAPEIERLYAQQAAAARRMNLSAELDRCHAYLDQRGKALAALGDRLIRVNN